MKTVMKTFSIIAVLSLAIIFYSCDQITSPNESVILNKSSDVTLQKATPERPFKGTIVYTVTGMDETHWFLSGMGNLTHLGKCTTAETIYFMEGRGEDTFTAADGSQIDMTWYSVTDNEATTTFVWTIIGGTGRFAGATGDGVSPPVVVNPDGTFIIEFIGTIKY